MPASARLAALRDRLTAEKVDAIAVTDVHNLAYCTGFPREFDDEQAHIGLVTAETAVLLTDSRYFEAFSAAAKGGEWVVELVTASLVGSLRDALKRADASRVALETSQTHARFTELVASLGLEVVGANGWVESLRVSKDAEELRAISAAQQLTDRAFEHLLGSIRVGVTERDLALDLEFFMRREGSEGVAFAPIVASGPNAALPHARPGDRALSPGDFLVLDFGARIDGYCADMTRTVVIGTASSRHCEIYETVLAANLAGIDAARAGVLGTDVDAVARAVIREAGFGEYFGHGLGHGVGLEVHEAPSVGSRGEAELPVGAVITIEPGVYLPGFGGVRIEDLAVVEASSVHVLTRSTKDLLEL